MKLSARNGDPLVKETWGVYSEGMTKSATVVSSVIFQVSMGLGCLATDMVFGLLSFSLYPFHKFPPFSVI